MDLCVIFVYYNAVIIFINYLALIKSLKTTLLVDSNDRYYYVILNAIFNKWMNDYK